VDNGRQNIKAGLGCGRKLKLKGLWNQGGGKFPEGGMPKGRFLGKGQNLGERNGEIEKGSKDTD